MEALTTAMTQVLTFAGSVITTILSNPVLAVFFAMSLVGAVIGIVSQLKHV